MENNQDGKLTFEKFVGKKATWTAFGVTIIACVLTIHTYENYSVFSFIFLFLTVISLLYTVLCIVFYVIKKMCGSIENKIKNEVDQMTTRGFKQLGIPKDKIENAIINAKTLEIFEQSKKTSSIIPIEKAISFIWEKQDQGKIPLLKDLNYAIQIDDYNQDIENKIKLSELFVNEDDKAKERWKLFFVNYRSCYSFDFPVHDEKNKFPIDQNFYDDLVSRLIQPIVVLTYKEYVNKAHIWDQSGFTVIYPITEDIIDLVKRHIENLPKQSRIRYEIFFRKIDWIKKSPEEFITDTKKDGWPTYDSEEIRKSFYMSIHVDDKIRHIEFNSVYNSQGEYDENVFNKLGKYKKAKNHLEEIKKIARDDSGIGYFIAGMYVPDIKEGDREWLSNLTLNQLSKVKIYSLWSYLNFEEITSNGKEIHKQDYFNFAVDYCAYFNKANVYLSDSFAFNKNNPVTVYSLYAYDPELNPSPHNSLSFTLKSIKKEATNTQSDNSKILLYPSDVFSLRWQRKEPKADTTSSSESDKSAPPAST